ncbi:hypothetical protein L6164_024714 [Bauhinia variegata]|uniref:Uncharacterized protein n=1 Tax=Bauhinia variegata TaxID=167791 RepID=A0ACB9LY41_BAUVA|nr:hypothetical protein L6164_024714 [Bauhinia variegata]
MESSAAQTHLVPSEENTIQHKDNPDYVAWKKKDKIVLLWLKSLTSDKILATLLAIQNPVTEDDLVNFILYGLDVDYRPFQTATNTGSDPISVDDLLGMLLQKEEKIEQAKPVPITANAANKFNLIPQHQSSDNGGNSKNGRRSNNFSGNHGRNSGNQTIPEGLKKGLATKGSIHLDQKSHAKFVTSMDTLL